MTRNRKRSRARTPPPAAHAGRISRRAQVWLATLGTVVGVATGMVALAKEVAPGPSGSAQASEAGFQQAVGPICEDVNRHDADRVRDAVLLGRRLRRAQTPLKARDALLETYQRTLRNAERDEAGFAALSPPRASAATQRATTRAWTNNLERLRGIVERLDGAGTWADLDAVADDIGRVRTPMDRNVSKVRTALLRLGGGQCHLEAQGVSRPVVLPPRPHPEPHPKRAPDPPVDPPPTQSPAPPSTAPVPDPQPVQPAPPATVPSTPVDPPVPTVTAPPTPVEPPAGGGGGGAGG
jgi:hypothetical protein